MAAPGYTAAASLYTTRRSYSGGIKASGTGAGANVVAQQNSGCTVSCDQWNGCNDRCGTWPPGLSNYSCWLNCLQPSIDCLNNTCAGPLPPDCTTLGCKAGLVCCDCVIPARCTTQEYCSRVLCKL
jgi:hypothetical protein